MCLQTILIAFEVSDELSNRLSFERRSIVKIVYGVLTQTLSLDHIVCLVITADNSYF